MPTPQTVADLPDGDNPIFLFSITSTTLLGQIVRGEIDAHELAKQEMRVRGFNSRGEWIGFHKPEEMYA